MNYNPTPRSELLNSPDAVKRHHDLVENEVIRMHLKIAIQEMQYRAASGTDPQNFNMCAASSLRLMGAQELVETFLNLAETPVAAPRKDNTNLPGNVSSLPRQKN